MDKFAKKLISGSTSLFISFAEAVTMQYLSRDENKINKQAPKTVVTNNNNIRIYMIYL